MLGPGSGRGWDGKKVRPSGYVKIAIENGPFIVDLPWFTYWKWWFIVDFPIDSMVIFQFAMLNYQRVESATENDSTNAGD